MERSFTYLCIVLLACCVLSGCSGHDNDPMPPPVDTGLEWDEGNWDEQEWQ